MAIISKNCALTSNKESLDDTHDNCGNDEMDWLSISDYGAERLLTGEICAKSRECQL